MVGGLKIIQVKPGLEQEFEDTFSQLRSQMWEYESGCLLFSLLKSRSNPRLYTVQEQYRDVEAMEEHNNSSHVSKYAPKLNEMIEIVEEEVFDVVVE
jgi:quinol monooxygenase YgiN